MACPEAAEHIQNRQHWLDAKVPHPGLNPLSLNYSFCTERYKIKRGSEGVPALAIKPIPIQERKKDYLYAETRQGFVVLSDNKGKVKQKFHFPEDLLCWHRDDQKNTSNINEEDIRILQEGIFDWFCFAYGNDDPLIWYQRYLQQSQIFNDVLDQRLNIE